VGPRAGLGAVMKAENHYHWRESNRCHPALSVVPLTSHLLVLGLNITSDIDICKADRWEHTHTVR